ncbi:UDP-N-acetylmuramoyl-tripeptide--D-alanyl-D-alanine ligase [Thiorhodococcus mannitoliphagus]|uniref:UDP-N-acetylmuramoyl-tripeptide--D-alanyl-D-alanine ligase n=1 Tax=Thiorhodococcus mannitoliphagus TaxID=329406 RepID=A0A6P1DPU6_9GAMM|nr:UDP-N-acetylmuramoyl-tripeptide--D-alanyl-D-alanine ligase [Thiorhodococcus mannitoliphagus]
MSHPRHRLFTPAEIAAVTAGRWLRSSPRLAEPIAGIGIDSRTLAPGEAYVAIVGERFDGHDFVSAAAGAGAALALVERAPAQAPASLPLLQVGSCVAALQALAAAWRERLHAGGCRVVGICGSNGKTTTRHLIHQLLHAGGLAGSQSPKSFNNHLGVPLTLLTARPEHAYLLCEIGTNHPGEIAALGAIVRPDIAVLTSLGEEHLEFFGDLQGVAREEAALIECVAPGGTALVPAEGRLPVALPLSAPSAVTLRRFDLDPLAQALPLPGEHNRLNASAAAAVARLFGIHDVCIAAAIRSASHAPLRGEVLFADDPARPTVINDAYNANPSSMRAALAMLAAHPGRRVAVLADMLELGEGAAQAHREIADLACATADLCLFVGPLFAEALAQPGAGIGGGADRFEIHSVWSDAVAVAICRRLLAGDTVLLKGSRSMALERLLPVLEWASR